MAICGTFFAVSQVGLVVYLVDHRLVTTVYFEVPLPILPQQALLYRLCGDRNPLAALGSGVCCCSGLSAPDSARPVHVRGCVQGDRGQRARWRVSRVHSYGCPVAGVLFPGETLRASIWKEGDKLLAPSPLPVATTPPCCPVSSSPRCDAGITSDWLRTPNASRAGSQSSHSGTTRP